MAKTAIEWTDWSLNPIQGRCKGGCFYCYTMPYYNPDGRFKLNPEVRLDLTVFDKLPKKPIKIFLCSTHDIFGSWIPRAWRKLIFTWIKKYPQHIFQVLTKFPENIDVEIPDNVWLGVSVTNNSDAKKRIPAILGLESRVKFVSVEPFFRPLYRSSEGLLKGLSWIIVGRLTQHGKGKGPGLHWVEGLVSFAKKNNISIFLKNNLKDIWPGELIQELPE